MLLFHPGIDKSEYENDRASSNNANPGSGSQIPKRIVSQSSSGHRPAFKRASNQNWRLE